MYKQISVWSFWLGLACTLLAIIFRALAAVAIWPVLVPAEGAGISYVTFQRAAETLLLLSLAAKFVPSTEGKKQ